MTALDSGLVPFLALGIVACAAVARFVWVTRTTRGRLLFVLGSAAACLWMLGDLVGRTASTFAGQYAAEIVRYVGVVNVPVWTLAFTRAYCGRRTTPRTLALLFVLPTISLAVMATSLWHRRFFATMAVGTYGLSTTFGPYFWYVHLPYCYLLTVLGYALVLSEIARVPRQFRQQLIFLFASLAIPFVINFADMLGLLGRSYNTALSFPIFAVLLSVGVFRTRLLRVNPVAYETALHAMQDGVVILSREDTILDINATAARHTGRAPADLIGARFRDAFAEYRELLDQLADRREVVSEWTHVVDGATSYYTLGTWHVAGPGAEYDGRVVTLRDVTVLRRHQRSLEAMAYVDPLTELANRRRFEDEVGKALQRAARRDEPFAILYFDLNRFKAVNDTLGHDAGDELLKLVAARTSTLLRAPDFLARLGGDEFVALLHGATPGDVPAAVTRLRDGVQQPATVLGHDLTPSLSVGAACFPRDGDTLQTLLRHADAAMYAAKAQSA